MPRIPLGRDEDGDGDPETHTPFDPPRPGSYALPLFLVIAICAGYLAWRYRQRTRRVMHTSTVPDLGPVPRGVRLSTEDDGPASHSFLANNDSTDSLPSHALSDLPVLSDLSRGPSPSPLPHLNARDDAASLTRPGSANSGRAVSTGSVREARHVGKGKGRAHQPGDGTAGTQRRSERSKRQEKAVQGSSPLEPHPTEVFGIGEGEDDMK